MIRVYVVCEGQTEETFVKELLAKSFHSQNIFFTPILIGSPGHKGGNFRFSRVRIDIQKMLGDQTAYCTTFFDFYGLPNDFPGKSDAASMVTIKNKAKCVQDALENELSKTIQIETLRRRFIPYVQMYEFEALLFSNPEGLANGIGQQNLASPLQKIRNSFGSPEHINDNRDTAPSKRILSLASRYEKPIYGTLAALEIGLLKIREECQLFDAWLKQIEELSTIP